MKVLCPTDFSKASVNASKWLAHFLSDYEESKVHLLHCVNIRSRAGMFLKMDKIFIDRAEEDMNQLIEELKSISNNVTFTSSVVVYDPKTYITTYAQNHDFDLIVTGTKGLTALKDMTIGSVTQYIVNNSNISVLAIPDEIDYKKIKSIVIGVDDRLVAGERVTKPLIEICKKTGAKLWMVHVRKKGDSPFEYDPGLDIYFRELNYEYKALEYDESVAETLTEYCDDVDADMLCMIHRQRNWLENLMHRSFTKSELFKIETPLLVLHGGHI